MNRFFQSKKPLDQGREEQDGNRQDERDPESIPEILHHVGMVIVVAAAIVARLMFAVVMAGLLMAGMPVLMRLVFVVHLGRCSGRSLEIRVPLTS